MAQAVKAQNPIPHKGPLPNRGASIPDVQILDGKSTDIRKWQKARGIDRSKQIKITKLSHMRYQHPDLDKIITFLEDFGMQIAKRTDQECWFHGYGPDQYVYYARQGPKEFLGGTFEVESRDELEKVLKIPGVTVASNGLEELTAAPGGGYIVSITDPGGFPVNFIWGQAPVTDERKVPANLVLNFETEKNRRKAFQRFEPGPAEVYKLGHFGLSVENFAEQQDWYTRHFNLVPTDIQYISQETVDPETNAPARLEVVMFAHIDRGAELVDHHSLLLAALPSDPGFENHVHHSSFEVHDFDTQALGHQWLAQKNYESVWGVGRHILGSQIFDYWRDVSGFMIEHYADGDVVNESTPIGFEPAGPVHVWGPEMPKIFVE